MTRTASRRGSALILVFWCLLLLGLAVFGVVQIAELSVTHSAHEQTDLQAQAWAESGLAIALNPLVLKNDPILIYHEKEAGYEVALSSEGARLNLNFVLNSGHREILQRLFIGWGLSLDEANALIDSMLYWISPPGTPAPLNAAIERDYTQVQANYYPTHHNFQSLAEVSHVLGMERVLHLHPDWSDQITLWSSGPLNVNEASPELLAVEFGISVEQVGAFTRQRNGPDQLAGTADDRPVTDLKTLQVDLGLTDAQMQGAGVSFSDPVRHIESIGQNADRRAKLTVVVDTTGPHYYLWSLH